MPDAPISFARGAPAPELLPATELAECAFDAARRWGAPLFAYGPGAGHAPLREWVAARHGVDSARVVLTVGGLLGFVLYAGEMLARRPGRVLVEAPTYDRPLKILAREGVEVVPLETDAEGLDPAAVEEELRRNESVPAFLYTIPTFQNPSGHTLGRAGRDRLLQAARETGATILEDDPYGLLRFEGDPLPQLFELSGGEGAILLSSFSKTVSPGIRVGYVVLPEELVGAIERQVLENYVSPSIFAQAALAEFVHEGFFEPNLEHACEGLRIRRDAMLGALEREAPEGLSWNEPEGGYFLWLELPEGVDAGVLLARGEEAGVTFVKGSDFFLNGGGTSSARLAYSFETADEIGVGVERLAGLVREAAGVTA